MPKSLPTNPNIEWLKKAAKEQLASLRKEQPSTRLHQAQLDVAREYGFASWRALKSRVDALSLDGQIANAIVKGKPRELAKLLDAHPGKLRVTGGTWKTPLLHLSAEHGQAACVDVLLKRGFPIDARDNLDNATALHWAAYSGNIEIIQKLLKAGADIHAEGDTHEVGLIGWAAFFSKPQLEAAKLLLARGARANIFGAVAVNRGDLVRQIVEKTPGELSRKLTEFDHERTPLHVAVVKSLPDMVKLLVDLGADIRAKDHEGRTPLNLVTGKTNKSIAKTLITAGADPKELGQNTFELVIPILSVKNVPASTEFYMEKLGFIKHWDWGKPPTFASVGRGQVTIFFCEGDQGNPGTWLWIRVQDVDALFEDCKERGVLIRRVPTSQPWGVREMLIEDPDGHMLRLASDSN